MRWEAWNTLAEDEKHWENSFEKGLLKAEYLDGFRLRLWFEEDLDVAIYELDFYPLLFEENPGKDLLPLRDPERFQFVEGNYALIWPNPETGAYDEAAIDLAPECVRFLCTQYSKVIKAPKTATRAKKSTRGRTKAPKTVMSTSETTSLIETAMKTEESTDSTQSEVLPIAGIRNS